MLEIPILAAEKHLRQQGYGSVIFALLMELGVRGLNATTLGERLTLRSNPNPNLMELGVRGLNATTLVDTAPAPSLLLELGVRGLNAPTLGNPNRNPKPNPCLLMELGVRGLNATTLGERLTLTVTVTVTLTPTCSRSWTCAGSTQRH